MSELLTGRLLDFIHPPSVRTFSDDVLRRALPSVVDTFGVMLAGKSSKAGEAILRYADHIAPSHSPVTWLGLPRSLPPDTHALVAATLGNAYDFDDDRGGVGHPSSIIVAALTTLAQTRQVSGREFLEAYVVGYETTVTVALGMGGRHYRHGWHTSGTIGGFGATAAAAQVLGLSREETASALGICASQAAGLQRNFGSTTKAAHSGFAARNGLSAALMAATGMTADAGIIDGAKGLYEVYSLGEARPDVYERIGTPLQIVEPGPTLKRYPCSYASHRAIDAALEIRSRSDLDPDRIRKIVCRVPTLGLIPLVHHRPETGLQGKASIEYVIAAALLDGTVDLASFEDSAVRREPAQRLIELVDAAEDPECRPEDPAGRHSSSGSGGFVDLRVEFHDGTIARAVVEHASGSPDKPMSARAIEDKFLMCAKAGGVERTSAQNLLNRLYVLAEADDVRAVLQPNGAPGQS